MLCVPAPPETCNVFKVLKQRDVGCMRCSSGILVKFFYLLSQNNDRSFGKVSVRPDDGCPLWGSPHYINDVYICK